MNKKKYLTRGWFDPRLVVKESKINGRGVFASKDIKSGEIVMIWGGEEIPRANFNEDKWRIQTVVPISETQYLGLPISDKGESIDEFLNHACDSNTWLIDEVTMSARKDISANEEITLDQAMWNDDEDEEYADEQKCTCGVLSCRKKLTGHDWTMGMVQEKYQGHFSPFIQRKIDQLGS